MKKLFLLLVLLVAGAAGFGFFRGWFQFSTESADQKSHVTLTVDWDKIQQDKEKAREKIGNAGATVKDKTGNGAENVENPQPQP